MIDISYTSDKFPPHLGPNFQGTQLCTCSWSDLVWACMTVGKARQSYLLYFGRYSCWELINRASFVYANLRQSSNRRVHRSDVYIASDPSEKTAISYFLGLASAKLLSEKYLHVPWLVWCLDYPDTRGVDRFFSSTGPPPVGTLKKGSLD